MQRIETTIVDTMKQEIHCTFIIVEKGERVSQIRKQLGRPKCTITWIGGRVADVADVEEYAIEYDASFDALVKAGVDFDNVSAVMELI